MKKNRNCLNCNHTISEEDSYCANCGQNTSEPKLSVKALVVNFFTNVLNLDSKFFGSLRSLFIPGKFTVDYVAGKRVKYYSPGRILFVSMVIFFFLLAMTISEIANTESWGTINEGAWSLKKEIKFDSLKTVYREELQDSLPFLDSLKADLFVPVDTSGSFKFTTSDKDTSGVDIELYNLLTMSEDEYFEKKKIDNDQTKFLLRQLKKSAKDVKGFVNFMIGNLTWMFILISISLAALMKFLYIRRGYYYAEHVIFQMHFLSFALVLGSIFLIVTLIRDEFDNKIFFVFTLLSGLYLFIALKNYYKQGFFKTTIKYIFLLLGYFLSFFTFVILISVISFLLL
jgi:hypothetical protein